MTSHQYNTYYARASMKPEKNWQKPNTVFEILSKILTKIMIFLISFLDFLENVAVTKNNISAIYII